MFIGHFAIGMAAKSLRPSVSLGTYFLAVQWVDLLWPTLLLFGVEHVSIEPGITETTPLNFEYYPFTHSLVMTVVWSAAAFLLARACIKDTTTHLLIAFCVASHWLLDFFTHRPDLPLAFSESVKVGLGLWNNKGLTIIIESLLFIGGVFLYSKATHPLNKTGSYSFWSLIIFFIIIHISNMFGPPPPNVSVIAWAGHLQWLFVVWAYWTDGHRQSVKNISV
jgi:hypothetical protein